MDNLFFDTLEDEIKAMHNKSVAIVGNGIFKNELGSEINKHDIVIRFNRYKLNGYKRYVGSKTSYWCVHPHQTANERNWDKCITVRRIDEHKSCVNVIRPARDYFTELCNGDKAPSSGMTLCYIFNDLGIKANAYGFSDLKGGHYWNSNYKPLSMHNSSIEQGLKKKLTLIDFKEC